MKPRIKPLQKTGDAERYLVNGKVVIVPGCLIAATRKHPLDLLAQLLRGELEG